MVDGAYAREYQRLDRGGYSIEIRKAVTDRLIRPLAKGHLYSNPRIFSFATLLRRDDKSLRIVLVLRFRPKVPNVLVLDITSFTPEEIAKVLDLFEDQGFRNTITKDVGVAEVMVGKLLNKQQMNEDDTWLKTYKYSDIYNIQEVRYEDHILLPFLKKEIDMKAKRG